MAETIQINALPSRAWPVDRPAAAVRGLWRLFGAVLMGLGLYVPLHDITWEQLWRNERLLAMSGGLILAAAAGAALALGFAGLRWLALAAWPAPIGVRIDARGIEIHAGPFGSQSFDWNRATVSLDGDLDPAMLASLPGDAVGVHLSHPEHGGDLLSRVRVFVGGHGKELTSELAPFLMQAAGERPE